MTTSFTNVVKQACLLALEGVATAQTALATASRVLAVRQGIGLVLAGLVVFVPARDLYAAGELVFKSSFGQGVSTSEVYASPITEASLAGLDQETGYTWGAWSANPIIDNMHFQYVASTPYSDWVTTRILSSFSGRANVIQLEVKGNDPDKQRTRNELEVRPKSAVSNNFQAYNRYWMYLPSDYVQNVNLSEESWNLFAELKHKNVSGMCCNGSWRFNFQIRIGGSTPYWALVKNYQNPSTGSSVNDGTISNTKAPVPLGRWFLVEQFYKKHSSNGRIWLAIDGKVVFDFNGRTEHPTNPTRVDFYSVLKSYRGNGHRFPYSHYYDHLEIWTDFPGTGSPPASPAVPSGVEVWTVGND